MASWTNLWLQIIAVALYTRWWRNSNHGTRYYICV